MDWVLLCFLCSIKHCLEIKEVTKLTDLFFWILLMIFFVASPTQRQYGVHCMFWTLICDFLVVWVCNEGFWNGLLVEVFSSGFYVEEILPAHHTVFLVNCLQLFSILSFYKCCGASSHVLLISIIDTWECEVSRNYSTLFVKFMCSNELLKWFLNQNFTLCNVYWHIFPAEIKGINFSFSLWPQYCFLVR